MLSESAQRFSQLLHDPATTAQAAHEAARAVMNDYKSAPAGDRAVAMRIVSEAVATARPSRATLAAILAGGMIEDGENPRAVIEPLVTLLRKVTADAKRMHDACAANTAGDKDPGEQFDANLKRFTPTMVPEAEAWDVLGRIYLPVVTVFSVAPEARVEARDLVRDLAPMARENEGAHWIVKVIGVLHNEPFVALEPATNLGIVGRMSGISENFQLNVLLMDVFPQKGGWFSRPKRRVSESAARIARGEGPQQSEETVTGFWNLYTYRALRPDGSLPDAGDFNERDKWIWNEGTPVGIPALDGHRVIVLGPASYQRGWGAQRDFAVLKAELAIDEQLSPVAVQEWLTRIVRENA
jgi:hypothetical protein